MGDAFMAPDIIEQVAAGAGPKKKPPHCGGFELLAEWTSIEPAFQGVPRHPDIACRSLICIDFLTNLVHSDSKAFR